MAIRDELLNKVENKNNTEVIGSKSEPMIQGDVFNGEDDTEDSSSVKKINILENKKVLTPIIIIAGILIVTVLILLLAKGLRPKEKEGPADFVNETEESDSFSYTDEERDELRIVGYDADEIKSFESQEKNAEEVISAIKQKRKEEYEKEMAPLRDKESKEFKELKDLTWISQEPLEYDKNFSEYTYHNFTLNADYERLPAMGQQLFVKVYIAQDKAKYCFMTVTPERYARLEASGNILLSIDYTNAKGKYIITNIVELET